MLVVCCAVWRKDPNSQWPRASSSCPGHGAREVCPFTRTAASSAEWPRGSSWPAWPCSWPSSTPSLIRITGPRSFFITPTDRRTCRPDSHPSAGCRTPRTQLLRSKCKMKASTQRRHVPRCSSSLYDGTPTGNQLGACPMILRAVGTSSTSRHRFYSVPKRASKATASPSSRATAMPSSTWSMPLLASLPCQESRMGAPVPRAWWMYLKSALASALLRTSSGCERT